MLQCMFSEEKELRQGLFNVVQGTDIPILEALPLLLADAHLERVQLRPACYPVHIERTTIRGRAANKR